MPNPIYNVLSNSGMNQGIFGNMPQMMQQFNQFRNGFQGDPKAQVQQLLNSGRMSQQQYQQLSQMASQFMQFLPK